VFDRRAITYPLLTYLLIYLITGESREKADDANLYDEEGYKRGDTDEKLAEAYDDDIDLEKDSENGYGLAGGARTLARVASRSASDKNSPSPISDVYFVGKT